MADAVRRFFRECLTHVKGEWAGQPFVLRPWQEDVVLPLLATLREDGLRRYRTGYVEVARKNGKSTLAAGIALYLLVADQEPGAEVYIAAVDRDQAGIIFRVAAEMVRRSPSLSRVCEVIDSRKTIVVPATGSFLRAIPADAAGAHGFDAHAVIADELHAWPSRELWDVLTTSTGSRRQPLVLAITTAGHDRDSICWELHSYAQQVLEGTVDDPTFFARIFAVPEDADWTDPMVWGLANPALGDFRDEAELARMVERAKGMPSLEMTVRQLYLNQWTQAAESWLRHGVWEACAGDPPDEDDEELEGRPCYGGLDLSATSDFTALVWVFPPADDDQPWDVRCRFWLPQASLQNQRAGMRAAIERWAAQGALELVEGDRVDYRLVRRRVLEDAERYDVRELGYDAWAATETVLELASEGITVVPVRQGTRTLSAPTRYLESLLAQRRIRHGGHPVLTWMARNVVLEVDPWEHVKPSKRRSVDRIDGITALVTALERALAYVHEGDAADFVYVPEEVPC